MADPGEHIRALPVYLGDAAAWMGTIASGNLDGSSRTWHEYERLQRPQMTSKLLRQVSYRHLDYPVKILGHLYGCHALTPAGSSAPAGRSLTLPWWDAERIRRVQVRSLVGGL